MIRGVLAGLLTGFAASGLVLGGVSVLGDFADLAALRQAAPEAAEVELPPGSGFDAVREDREAALPEAGESPGTGMAPRVEAPSPDDTAALAGADTAPVRLPATGEAGALGAAPVAGATTGGIAVEGESPVLPSPQAEAPSRPEGEARLAISTGSAQPPATGAAGALGAAPAAPQTRGGLAVEGESPVLPSPQALAPTRPEGEARLDIATEPAQPRAPDPGESGSGLIAPRDTPASEDAPAPEESATIAPVAPDEDAPAPATPRRITPSGTIGNRADGVTLNRLPRIGDAPEEEADTEAAEAAAPDAAEAVPEGALARNAVPFEAEEGRPLMAIVLIDEGENSLGIEALAAFPYPLSFAIPAKRADAADLAARYRAAGFEVLIAADLPAAATAADVEIAMQSWLAAIPQAVAVLEGTGSGLQSSREASVQLAPILKESGHGIVMLPNGLNTAQRLIAREGVPSATLFRDFDGQGQDAAAVRRFLDQAAMRALQQQEGVIMLGRVRPDTISALLLWGLQDRAASVALAPVSALLRAQQAQ